MLKKTIVKITLLLLILADTSANNIHQKKDESYMCTLISQVEYSDDIGSTINMM